MSRVLLLRVSVLVALTALFPGCRTANSSSSSAGLVGSPARPESSADVLRYAEIESGRVKDAHEAVTRFRPEFLKPRVSTSQSDPTGGFPVVYIDGTRQGGTEYLRTVPARVIVEIRYLSPTAATHEFGRFHAGGVISVRTRR